MKQNGQVLLVAAIILALIVIGWIVAMQAVGADISHAQNCVEVIYNSGVKELVCQ